MSSCPYKKKPFSRAEYLPFNFLKEESVTLDQYMAVRNGITAKALVKPGLSNAEGKIFGLDVTKKGWHKKNTTTQIPMTKIKRAVRNMLGTYWIDNAMKKRLSDAFIDPNEFDEQYIYLIHSEAKISKIGISKDPVKRVASLQTGHGLPLKVVAYWAVKNNPYQIESALHKAFADKQMEGEWFRGLLTPDQVSSKLTGVFEKFTPMRQG